MDLFIGFILYNYLFKGGCNSVRKEVYALNDILSRTGFISSLRPGATFVPLLPRATDISPILG